MYNLNLTPRQWMMLLSEVEFICDAKEIFTNDELVVMNTIRRKLELQRTSASYAITEIYLRKDRIGKHEAYQQTVGNLQRKWEDDDVSYGRVSNTDGRVFDLPDRWSCREPNTSQERSGNNAEEAGS
jgi:hypothetical protein